MESPYKEILIFVFGGGLISGIIAVSKEIRERVAEKKKQKLEESAQHLSQTVELQRLENESDGALFARLEAENIRLNDELKELRASPSLSFATQTKWYKTYRQLGVKIDKHETHVVRELPNKILITSLEDLKKKYDELGETMP